MRKRDLGILLLAAFAIFFSLQHGGDFSFEEAWYHLSDEYPIKYEGDRLPPPIVADLNGDGRSEILVATHDAKIQVLEAHSRRADEGFSESRVLSEVSLLPDKIRVLSGRRPVAMATGFVDRVQKHGEIRKQVLVVVTSGWSVMCFDHNLKKLWENNLQDDFPHFSYHREVAISISNYTLKHGDSGLIIVGGRMEMKHHTYMDPFEESDMSRQSMDDRHQNAKEEASKNTETVDLRHFAFYAFAGRSGILRWRRKNEASRCHGVGRWSWTPRRFFYLKCITYVGGRFNVVWMCLPELLLSSEKTAGAAVFAGEGRCCRWRRSPESQNIEGRHSDASELIPQHNYKLDVHAMNSRRPGEFECREFRESVLGVMPHSWDRREDTYFQLAHFRRHKRKVLKKTIGRSSTNPFHMPVENHGPGKDSSNKISNVIEKAASYAGTKSKKKLPYVPTITNYTQLWWVPNVVVAHQKEGIEAVHLASGRTICKLHLPEGGLHADINGDGVLDHVQVVGGHGAEQTVVGGSMEVLRPCWAVATSGVPVREQLFNASICHHTHFNLFQRGDFSRSFGRNVDTGSLEVVTPILVPRDDGHKHRKGSHGDVIFFTNRGEVTAYSPGLHGQDVVWRWQMLTGATWSNPPFSETTEAVTVPTLKAFSLQAHDKQQVIIISGEQEAVILSPGGSQLATIELPAPPTHVLVLEDFSNDGLTDIIVVTSAGVYGFVQTRQPGALFFSTLVGCLIVIIGVIFVSQHLSSTGKNKPRASSDYR